MITSGQPTRTPQDESHIHKNPTLGRNASRGRLASGHTGDSVQKTFFPSELRDKSDKTDIRNVHTFDIVVK